MFEGGWIYRDGSPWLGPLVGDAAGQDVESIRGTWCSIDPHDIDPGFMSFDGAVHAIILGDGSATPAGLSGAGLPTSFLFMAGSEMQVQRAAIKPALRHAFCIVECYSGPSTGGSFYKAFGVVDVEPGSVYAVGFPSISPMERITVAGTEYLITSSSTILLCETTLTEWLAANGVSQSRLLPS